MSKHEVWSTHVPEEGEPFKVLEVTRTDQKTANEDAALIRDVLHRRSWVQDQEGT
jgi:hypothetical protein